MPDLKPANAGLTHCRLMQRSFETTAARFPEGSGMRKVAEAKAARWKAMGDELAKEFEESALDPLPGEPELES